MVAVDSREGDFGRDFEIEYFSITGVHRLNDDGVYANGGFGRDVDLSGEGAVCVSVQDSFSGNGGTIAKQLYLLAGFETFTGNFDGATRIGRFFKRNTARIVSVNRMGQAASLYANAERQGCQCDSQGGSFELSAGANTNRMLFH
ncbi:MAG: hypothetical protein Q4B13_09925 [Lautropia sp.]|nr:hypothetical protein [Lautropia sp.]